MNLALLHDAMRDRAWRLSWLDVRVLASLRATMRLLLARA
jgi:hypothetical protein